MANRVFFSFHYQDVIDFRANTVRNHWVCKPNREAAGFFDASIWETAKKTGDMALKRLINSGLNNTSVTCVLIGSETYRRRWVKYEIFKSIEVGNKLVGIHINKIKGKDQKTKPLGYNPLDWLGIEISADGKTAFPIEYNGQKWVYNNDFDSIKLNPSMASSYWGKTYQLSNFYSTYCWVDKDGYNNFSNWLK